MNLAAARYCMSLCYGSPPFECSGTCSDVEMFKRFLADAMQKDGFLAIRRIPKPVEKVLLLL